MDIRRLVAPVALTLAAACSDNTGPAGPMTGKHSIIPDSSAVVWADSFQVAMPAGTAWTASHSLRAQWITLLDSAGSGPDWLRFQRDNAVLVPGLYVDTILVIPVGGGQPQLFIDSLDVTGEPAEFIVRRRAWLPGERDAQVAAIIANGSLWAFSEMAPTLLPMDSTTEVVPNPAYPGSLAAARGLWASVHGPTTAGMTLFAVDLWTVDTTSPPQQLSDTVQWLEVFWYQTSSPTYKGYLAIFSRTATHSAVTMNTTNWDATSGTAGGGGGEIKPSTGEYWQATAGSLSITANSARGAAGSAITSGPYTGGTQRSGLMGGRIQNVRLTRILPGPGGNQTGINLDFRTSRLPAARIECLFNFPCTSVAAAPILDAMRRGDLPTLHRLTSGPPPP